MNTPRTLDNEMVKYFLAQFINYQELPSWLDDVIRGAVQQARATTSTGTISKTMLFRILQAHEVITVETVVSTYNRKRVALGDKPVSERMGRYIAAAARCASQAIHYHIENHTVNLYEEIVNEPEEVEIVFTEEQKSELRELALSGNNKAFTERHKVLSKEFKDTLKLKAQSEEFVSVYKEPTQEEKDKLHLASLSRTANNAEVSELYNKTWDLQ